MDRRAPVSRTEYVPLRDFSESSSTYRIDVNKPLPQPTRWTFLKLKTSRLKAQFKRKLPKLPKWISFTGWRMIVTAGAGISVLALVANIVLLIWASRLPQDPQTGAAIIYSGSLGSMQSMLTWSRLAINVLSTLLLGASNATMQCLTAPTREEVCDTSMR